jgi:hypothetical protein
MCICSTLVSVDVCVHWSGDDACLCSERNEICCAYYLGGDHSCTKLLCLCWKSGISPQLTHQPSPVQPHPWVSACSLQLQKKHETLLIYVPYSRASYSHHPAGLTVLEMQDDASKYIYTINSKLYMLFLISFQNPLIYSVVTDMYSKTFTNKSVILQ